MVTSTETREHFLCRRAHPPPPNPSKPEYQTPTISRNSTHAVPILNRCRTFQACCSDESEKLFQFYWRTRQVGDELCDEAAVHCVYLQRLQHRNAGKYGHHLYHAGTRIFMVAKARLSCQDVDLRSLLSGRAAHRAPARGAKGMAELRGDFRIEFMCYMRICSGFDLSSGCVPLYLLAAWIRTCSCKYLCEAHSAH